MRVIMDTERRVDLWTYEADAVVVPTNRHVNSRGLVMGAGVADQARKMYPFLPDILARRMMDEPSRLVFAVECREKPPRNGRPGLPGRHVIALPTKQVPWEPADRALIERALPGLVRVANHYGFESVVLPALGCGLGGLTWEEVRVPLGTWLDDRFTVIVRPENLRQVPAVTP